MINDASNPGHFNWHVYTRMNWGEPWYAGFRESQTQYRLKNQNYYARNLMPRMLGWFQMSAETTLEDAEWLLARAAGFDAGFCLVTSPAVVKGNALGEAILGTIRRWEKARLAGAFTEAQKPQLRDIKREFQLREPAAGELELVPVHSVKGMHERREQPGMVTVTEFLFDNPYGEQPLQFILQAGKTGVDDLVLERNGREIFALSGQLAAGQILRFDGGDQVRRCDARGHTLESLKVNRDRMLVAPGSNRLRVGARLSAGDGVGVKCEFRALGAAERLAGS